MGLWQAWSGRMISWCRLDLGFLGVGPREATPGCGVAHEASWQSREQGHSDACLAPAVCWQGSGR